MLKRNPLEETDDENETSSDSVESQSQLMDVSDSASREAEFDNVDSDDEEFDGTEDDQESGDWFDSDTKAFLVSMAVHVLVIVGLASITIATNPEVLQVFIDSSAMEEPVQPLDVLSDIAYSESPSEEIGSNSIGDTDMALAEALTVSDVSELTSVPIDVSIPQGEVNVALDIKQAMGINESKSVVKGLTGVGVNGTEGAVDRITYELLRSIEERPTLVCWLFDSSVSMARQREEIRTRFDKIYEELGIVAEEQKKRSNSIDHDAPLLTSIVSFGMDVEYLTERPTASLEEIRSAVDSIEVDETGTEMTFRAVKNVAEKYKSFRVARGPKGPDRNVILIVVTDERGDDANACEEAISVCKKFGIQSHVLGVPAPFGREFTYIKFVDPDPKYDQTQDWRQVDQGPETLVPERVLLGYQNNYFEEPVIDSGFGPYALSRMCFETGGIYFSIHPNRKVGKRVDAGEIEVFASRMSQFFAPDVMERYRPDYLVPAEYKKQIQQSPLRTALVQASARSRVGTLDKPRQTFIKTEEARFISDLTMSQQESARLAPELFAMVAILSEGEKHKSKEASPRWLASFDLSFGTTLAAKVRAESYNAMLAFAKRGMPFEKEKSNTWNIVPSDKITVDSRLEKEAKLAKQLLQAVVDNHPGTPWAFLAARELSHPIGWEWRESFTDLNPPRANNRPNNNNNNPPPRDDEARMLKPPLPKRPMSKI